MLFGLNGSNKNIKVYNEDSSKQLGTIFPREVCSLGVGEEWGWLYFLNSQGKLQIGRFRDDPEVYNSGFNFLYQYPYSQEYINGRLYNIFKMRRAMPVYTATGRSWGSVAANMYVACEDCEAGNSHVDWMLVYYVKSTSGQWVKVTGDGFNHGFVDTGLSTASGYNTWAIQGGNL